VMLSTGISVVASAQDLRHRGCESFCLTRMNCLIEFCGNASDNVINGLNLKNICIYFELVIIVALNVQRVGISINSRDALRRKGNLWSKAMPRFQKRETAEKYKQ